MWGETMTSKSYMHPFALTAAMHHIPRQTYTLNDTLALRLETL